MKKGERIKTRKNLFRNEQYVKDYRVLFLSSLSGHKTLTFQMQSQLRRVSGIRSTSGKINNYQQQKSKYINFYRILKQSELLDIY